MAAEAAEELAVVEETAVAVDQTISAAAPVVVLREAVEVMVTAPLAQVGQ